MKKMSISLIFILLLTSCAPFYSVFAADPGAVVALTPTTQSLPTPTPSPTEIRPLIPNFDHIVLIVLENKDFSDVIGSSKMPFLNAFAEQYVLLANSFAVTHPSLPNYIALMSGGTQAIDKNCDDCFVDAPNLADLIEQSGRTWKAYLEGMPSACFLGNEGEYVQRHNPFLYFDSIRLNPERCNQGVVPIENLDADLVNNKLPNFVYLMPDLCNSGHDCSRTKADSWIKEKVDQLLNSPAFGENSLIIITFDEGSDKSIGSCCGLEEKAGGQIVTVLISSSAQPKYIDANAYSHYSLLKTILTAWNLPDLGETANPQTLLIQDPWSSN